MKKRILILLVFAFNYSFAQINSDNKSLLLTEKPIEKVILNTDRNLYLNGETIWFKAICQNTGSEAKDFTSNILYVELFNDSQKAIAKYKFKISNNVVNGAFQIPEEFISGHYQLRAYTQYLKNYSIDYFFNSIITIVNPEIPLTKNNSLPIDSITVSEEAPEYPEKYNTIRVQTNKESFTQREMVNLRISMDNNAWVNENSLSVSVIKKGTYKSPYLPGKLPISQTNQKISENLVWVPDIRNTNISGIAIDKENNTPKANVPIFLSVFKNNPQIHITNTKQNGEFIFSINNLENRANIFLTPSNNLTENTILKINYDFSTTYPQNINKPLYYSDDWKLLITEMYINHQATTIFRTNIPVKVKGFSDYPMNLPKPETQIIMAEYINTPTLKMVIDEILPNCILRRKDGQYRLVVFDAKKTNYYENPLILIDNIPVFNVNKLLEISPANIEKIEINYSPFMLGGKTIESVVKFTTNTDNFAEMEMPVGSTFLEYQTVSPAYNFKSMVYNKAVTRSKRLADFRTTLYWEPDVNINSPISFYTSDHCSEYEVIVRGYTMDGTPCYGKTSFIVTK